MSHFHSGNSQRHFGALPPNMGRKLPFTIGMTASYLELLWRTQPIANLTYLFQEEPHLLVARLQGNSMKPLPNFTKTDTTFPWHIPTCFVVNAKSMVPTHPKCKKPSKIWMTCSKQNLRTFVQKRNVQESR